MSLAQSTIYDLHGLLLLVQTWIL